MKDYFDYIGDYIDNKLSAQERAEFEVAMEKDAGLRQAVEDYDLIGMIGDGAFEEDVAGVISDELDNSKKIPSANGKSQSNCVKLFMWSILIACILVLTVIYFNKSEDNARNETLIAAVMQEYTPPQVSYIRSDAQIKNDSLSIAISLFSKKDFDASKNILESINLTTTKDKDQKAILLANIAFIKRDFKQSKAYLSLIEDKNILNYSELKVLLRKVN